MKTILIILFGGCLLFLGYLLCICCIFNSSDPEEDPYNNGGLYVYNYSDSAMYVYMACGVVDSLSLSPGLELFIKPEKEILDNKGSVIFRPKLLPGYRINAFSEGILPAEGDYYNPKLPCEEKVVTLFFIKEWIMRNYSWEQIYAGQLYVNKKEYTEDELRRRCWRISYISPKLLDADGRIIIPFYGYPQDQYN